jgi:hypothetical protein
MDSNEVNLEKKQKFNSFFLVAGIPADKIVEAHGTFITATCQRCRQKYECEEIRQPIFDDQIPKCTKTPRCTGVVKPDIVFFGEDLPRRFQLYLQDLPMCDCCIVMGTSLAVYPFADIVDSTTRSTPRVLINRQTVGTFLLPRQYDVAMIGDLEMNVKEFLTKLDAIDKVMELMKKENAENEKNIKFQNKSPPRNTSAATDRLKVAETFLEQKRKLSTFTKNRQDSQLAPQPKQVFNESTKIMIEKRNDALLFNRRRSKSALPALPLKPLSSSSSSSSSSDSLSETELMPFAFKRSSNIPTRPAGQIIGTQPTKVKRNPLLNATLRTVL